MGLGAILSKIFRQSLFTHQLAIGDVHEFDPLYPFLPTADNDLSILRNGSGFLEFCGGVVQARRSYVIDGVARFDEAVETFGTSVAGRIR